MSGIFDLPSIDTTGVPLAAVPAKQPLEDGTFDRIDLRARTREPTSKRSAPRWRACSATPTSRSPRRNSVSPTDRDAEIGIRHAYWALLSPNAEERYPAREFDGTTHERADQGYTRYKDTADQAELRIQHVNFVAPTCERRVSDLLRRRAVADHHRPAERRGSLRRRQVAHRRGHDVPARHLHRSAVRGVRPTSLCNRPTAGRGRTARRRSPRPSVSSRTRTRPWIPRVAARDRPVADALPGPATPRGTAAGVAQTGSTRAGPSSS